MDEDVLTKEQLSELLKIGVRTVDRLRKEGLPSVRVGNQVRFIKEDVLKWLRENRKN